MKHIVALLMLSAATLMSPAFAEPDAAGCKDHPLLTRMPGTYIYQCGAWDFDEVSIGYRAGEENKQERVEGKVTWLQYTAETGKNPHSDLAVIRNYQNAIKRIGGKVMGEFNGGGTIARYGNNHQQSGSYLTSVQLDKDGKNIWFAISASNGWIELGIAEREGMVQQVVADTAWLDAFKKVGFAAFDIHFDTGKATIKPDSKALLDQMAQGLKANPAFRVEVGGHTDNVGDAAANLSLSQARAQAVMAALASRGIAANRMTAKGYGQTVPVADNRIEEGRGKNRRVELVKL